jgi:osmotically-inducible protein OsmY
MNDIHGTRFCITVLGLTCGLMGMAELSNGQVLYFPNENGFTESISPHNGNPLPGKKKFDYGKAPYLDPVIRHYDYRKDLALSDEEVAEQITWRLRISPFVNGESIRVHVDEGTAVLSGYVEDRSAMVDAVEIAYDSGAGKVKNHLRMVERDEQPWRQMTNRELKEAVEQELYWSPFVNSDSIRVQVHNGIVTLSGRSENRREVANAVKNAYEAGARNVQNNLWVDPSLK